MPPTDPNFGDEAELRRFAHEVLTPMVERASQNGVA
jgi:TetR/AcrR family transcriptional repressor of uid operon